jgi:hypothetical protein
MQIVYSDYIRGMNAMAGGNYVTAFSIPGPLGAFFKSVKAELTSLANDIKVEFKDVIKCFANGEAFKLFKALKFSLTALLKGIRTFVALLPRGITGFFQELHDAGYVEKLRSGAVKVDEILHKYPVLKKLAGPAMAGLLFWMWTSMAFVGDPWTDFDISHIGDAMLGKYSIETLFTSPAGLTGLALLAAGLTVPGLPISWLGATLFNTLIAIAFTLGKKYAPAVAPKIRTLIPKGKFDKRDTSSPPHETANVKAPMSIREMQTAALSPKAYAMFKAKIAELNQDLVGIYHLIKTDGKFPPPLYLVQQANKLRRVANNPANVQNFKDLIKFMEVTLGTAMLKRKVQANGSVFTVEMRDAAKQMMREATKRIEDFANDMDSLDANGPQASVPALLTSYVDYFVYQLSMLSINGFIIKAELTNAKKVGVLLDKNKTRSVIPRKVKELLSDAGPAAPAAPARAPVAPPSATPDLSTLYSAFLLNLKQNEPGVQKAQAELLFNKCLGRVRNGTLRSIECEQFLRTLSPTDRREFALNPESGSNSTARRNANEFLDELVEEAMGLIEGESEGEAEGDTEVLETFTRYGTPKIYKLLMAVSSKIINEGPGDAVELLQNKLARSDGVDEDSQDAADLLASQIERMIMTETQRQIDGLSGFDAKKKSAALKNLDFMLGQMSDAVIGKIIRMKDLTNLGKYIRQGDAYTLLCAILFADTVVEEKLRNAHAAWEEKQMKSQQPPARKKPPSGNIPTF